MKNTGNAGNRKDNSYVIARLIYNDKLQSEKTINFLRFGAAVFLSFVILFYILFANKMRITTSEVFDIIAVSTAFIHSIVVFLLLRRNRLFRIMTFVSTFLDVSVIMLSVYAIQFAMGNTSSGAISQSFLILLVFYLIILTLRRHDAFNSLFTGLHAALVYAIFVFIMYRDGVFGSRFTSPDGQYFQPDLFFEICKVLFFIITGFAAFVISRKYDQLFWKSVQIESQARETAQRYEITFAQHQLGTFSCNAGTGLILDKNERFRKMLNIPISNNDQQLVFWDLFPNIEFRQTAADLIQLTGFYYFGKEQIQHGETRLWIEGSLTFEYGSKTIHGVIVDISDRIAHQEKLDFLNRKIKSDEPLRDLGMNLSGFMHNLKGHLHVILQGLEILQTSVTDDREEVRIPLYSIKNSTDIILEMAENQNNLASGLYDGKNEKVDFAEIIELAHKTITADPEAKTKIKFISSVDGSTITENRTEILSIIYNLLKNAKDAVLATANREKKVEISVYSEDNKLKIKVNDNGTGIAVCSDNACNAKSCLDCKYQNFGNTDKSTGSGLGLWSIRQYLKKVGGDIRFVSKKNKGTSVVVSLEMN
ncbi:MAG: sensor histidine kinase [Spirochaetales bacterium]|nr:sensor histidine kinase [Spirochaetales bacterium]